jgi:hypothetical protein
LPSPVNKVAAAPFCTSNGPFPLTQFWPYGVENCQSMIAHFCEQHQSISWNVQGLMV